MFCGFDSAAQLNSNVRHICEIGRSYPVKTAQKRASFETFYKKAKPIFRLLHARDKRAKLLTLSYNFCITPGGRDGGLDKRTVEVFWGMRPFDNKVGITVSGLTSKLLIEHGATLHYYLLDNGNVLVSLYPASSEDFRPIEENIFFDWVKNPTKLLKWRKLRKHWLFFRSYMDVTAFEGNGVLISRLLVWYLRNFRNTIIDKKRRKPKALLVTLDALKYVVTVGLSGFILVALSIYQSKQRESEIPKLL
jgi:hypothetical protein